MMLLDLKTTEDKEPRKMNTSISTNGNGYNIRLLTDSSKPEAANHRLSIIRFKTKKDSNGNDVKSQPNKCVSIPRIILEVTPSFLANIMTAAFHEMQDDVIRARVVEGAAIISTEDISYEAVTAFMEQKSQGQRLSGESVKHWFELNMKEPLMLALSNAMHLSNEPTHDELLKLDTAISQHETFIIGLASPRSNYPEAVVKSLQKAVALANDDDGVIKGKLESKLASFLERKETTLDWNL